MVPLGTPAHPFTLTDTVSGKLVALNEVKSDRATVIMFICNHCPYVKHVNAQLVQLARDYQPKGVSFIAVSSNDTETYPDDSPANMKAVAEQEGYPFPYLFDETQEVARAYNAACTPDTFIYDAAMRLAYRGQLDDSRPGNTLPVTGQDVRAALDALLAGQSPDPDQKPGIGCSIKWKK
jgi:peroxiredoxin